MSTLTQTHFSQWEFHNKKFFVHNEMQRRTYLCESRHLNQLHSSCEKDLASCELLCLLISHQLSALLKPSQSEADKFDYFFSLSSTLTKSLNCAFRSCHQVVNICQLEHKCQLCGCSWAGVLKLFAARDPFNNKNKSTDPFCTDVFYEAHYLTMYNNILSIYWSQIAFYYLLLRNICFNLMPNWVILSSY